MTEVREVASKGIAIVEFDKTAAYAADRLTDLDLGSLLVMKQGNVVGIVTERDLIRKVLVKNLDPNKVSVEDIMSHPLIMVEPTTDLSDANKMMSEKRIKRLPVMEGGQPIGILTMTDICNYLTRFRLDVF